MDICYLSTSVLKFNPALENPGFGCDVILLDLEDSVHVSAKAEARDTLRRLDLRPLIARGCRFGVRINWIGSIDGIRDLDAVYSAVDSGHLPIAYLHPPKVRSHHELLLCKSALSALSEPRPRLFPLIETPDAIEDIDRIAASSDVMMFGHADMVSSMYSPNEAYLGYARGRFCVASAREGIPAIDTRGFTELVDMEKFEAECWRAKGEGFTGKSVIHPRQIPAVKRVFGVSPEELESYRSTIARYAASNSGFTIVSGEVIAPPFVAKAERMLRLYGQ